MLIKNIKNTVTNKHLFIYLFLFFNQRQPNEKKKHNYKPIITLYKLN